MNLPVARSIVTCEQKLGMQDMKMVSFLYYTTARPAEAAFA